MLTEQERAALAKWAALHGVPPSDLVREAERIRKSALAQSMPCRNEGDRRLASLLLALHRLVARRLFAWAVEGGGRQSPGGEGAPT